VEVANFIPGGALERQKWETFSFTIYARPNDRACLIELRIQQSGTSSLPTVVPPLQIYAC